MKVKGNTLLSLKTVKLTSAVLFGLLLALRIYQTFALTDGETGFFTKNNITVPLMFILSAGAAVVICILCYLIKDFPAGDVRKRKSPLYAGAGLLFAGTLLYEGICSVRLMLSAGSGFSAMKEAVGGNVGLIGTVFAFLGAAALVLSVISYVKTGTLTGKLKIPMLFPVLWAFAETLGFFSVTVSYIKISQLFLAIYSAAFLMLFLFENARVTTGIGRKSALWFFYATGIITAGFCVATGVPALLATVFKPELVVEYCPFELYTLGGGLYAFASLFVRAEETAEINDTVTENE
ncbi:MAG: hypothetical protein IJN70_02960 [Clostridia bacterium]|nr:hypothetical protein [Clostridia bacterium]